MSGEAGGVTVRDLILALASYPLKAEIFMGENGGGGGELLATVGGENLVIWDGNPNGPGPIDHEDQYQ